MKEDIHNSNSNGLIDRLPELSDAQKEEAISNGALSWALNLLSENYTGLVQERYEYGLILQNVSTKLVRCIMVVNHPVSFLALQHMRATFDHLKAELEVGPYTVMRPYVENPAADMDEQVDGTTGSVLGPIEEIGMEVA